MCLGERFSALFEDCFEFDKMCYTWTTRKDDPKRCKHTVGESHCMLQWFLFGRVPSSSHRKQAPPVLFQILRNVWRMWKPTSTFTALPHFPGEVWMAGLKLWQIQWINVNQCESMSPPAWDMCIGAQWSPVRSPLVASKCFFCFYMFLMLELLMMFGWSTFRKILRMDFHGYQIEHGILHSNAMQDMFPALNLPGCKPPLLKKTSWL